LKIIPSTKRREFQLRKFFNDATRIWKYIVENSITDTSKVKGFGTKYLAAQFVQGMVREFRNLLKSQKELKKLGMSGRIKAGYKFTVTHFSGQPVKIIDSKHIRIQKLGIWYVRGLKQLAKYQEYKIATVKLLKRATGYYVHLTIKIEKQSDAGPSMLTRVLGLDIGIKDPIVTSNGYAINYKKHSRIEKRDRRVKRLQRLVARKERGSKNRRKARYLLRKAYEKSEFMKREIRNKIVSVFKNYFLVFQDELIKQWHSCGFKGIRRAVQHLALGKLIARFKTFEQHTMLPSYLATTKTCLKCQAKASISLDERTYHCNNCGYTMPRDKHSALNMLSFFGFLYQECISSPSVQFEFSEHELAKLQQAGISVAKI